MLLTWPLLSGTTMHTTYAKYDFRDASSSRTYYVRVGLHGLFGNEPHQAQHRVDQVIVHPQYTVNPPNYDIALLHLSDAIEYNEHVKPICLPNAEVPSGTRCVSSGWGDTKGKNISYNIYN